MGNTRRPIDECQRILEDRNTELEYAEAYWQIADYGSAADKDRAGEILGRKIGRPGWACIPGMEPWRYW